MEFTMWQTKHFLESEFLDKILIFNLVLIKWILFDFE